MQAQPDDAATAWLRCGQPCSPSCQQTFLQRSCSEALPDAQPHCCDTQVNLYMRRTQHTRHTPRTAHTQNIHNTQHSSTHPHLVVQDLLPGGGISQELAIQGHLIMLHLNQCLHHLHQATAAAEQDGLWHGVKCTRWQQDTLGCTWVELERWNQDRVGALEGAWDEVRGGGPGKAAAMNRQGRGGGGRQAGPGQHMRGLPSSGHDRVEACAEDCQRECSREATKREKWLTPTVLTCSLPTLLHRSSSKSP